MNERERWIVYPLLFFALGTALRDKIGLDRLGSPQDQVVAKEIILVNDNQEPVASLGGNKQGTAGELKLFHALPDQQPQERYTIGFDSQGQVAFQPPLQVELPGFMLFPKMQLPLLQRQQQQRATPPNAAPQAPQSPKLESKANPKSIEQHDASQDKAKIEAKPR